MKEGKQQGAGRPKTPYLLERIKYGTRLPRYIVNFLQKHSKQGRIIEETLIEKYKLIKPMP